jgi:Kef-type K+ transport system membrane component KefB
MSAVGAGAEAIVLRLLYQLIAILVTTRIVVAVVRRLGQTDVSGEILAGLVLGPSCLGALAPGLMQRLFHPSTAGIFVGLSQIGLVMLMFQIGLEFEFRATLGASKRSIVVISLAGLVAPFALGFATAPWFWSQLGVTPAPSLLGFRLFFAVAMSITAIPILGRIFMELGLAHTRTAALTIGAAAIDDVSGWLLLGVVSLIVEGAFSGRWVATRALGLAVYLAFVFLVARPLVRRAVSRHLAARGGQLSTAAIGLILIGLFVSAAITSNLGVFAIIGGFVVGVMLHDDRAFVAEWKLRVAPAVNTLLLPIFFTYTGLRTDIGLLGSAHEWILCGLVCLVAFVGKFGGAYAGARVVGESRRSALTIATCMNTRALMELIALNIGYDLGVLPRSMFTKLVIMAIVSTFMATPLIRWLMRAERRPDMLVPSSTEGTPCAASSPRASLVD